jgi:hypothetical protein
MLRVESPMARIVCSLARAHAERVGDGGLTVGFLGSSLHASLCDDPRPHRAIAALLSSLERAMAIVDGLRDLTPLTALDLCEVALSVLGSKPLLLAPGLRSLSALCARAFLHSGLGGGHPVRVVPVLGPAVSDSALHRGALLDFEVPRASRLPPGPHRLLLLDVGVGPAELADLRWLVGRVDILACQKVIPGEVQDALLEAGILPIERIGARFVGAIERVSGALAASVIDAQSPIGQVGGIETVHVGPRAMSRLCAPDEGQQEHDVVSLVVCSPSQVQLDELEVVAASALKVLAGLSAGGGVLRGPWREELVRALGEQDPLARVMQRLIQANPNPAPVESWRACTETIKQGVAVAINLLRIRGAEARDTR